MENNDDKIAVRFPEGREVIHGRSSDELRFACG